MEILEAWKSFARSVRCEDHKDMRAAFLAGYIAGSHEQMAGAEETHRRVCAELKKLALAEMELAMAQLEKSTGVTQ